MAIALAAGARVRLPLGFANVRQDVLRTNITACFPLQGADEGKVSTALRNCISLVEGSNSIGPGGGRREQASASEEASSSAQLPSIRCNSGLRQSVVFTTSAFRAAPL